MGIRWLIEKGIDPKNRISRESENMTVCEVCNKLVLRAATEIGEVLYFDPNTVVFRIAHRPIGNGKAKIIAVPKTNCKSIHCCHG